MPPRKSTHRSPARFIARTLSGAKPAPFPGFVEPCLATLKTQPPAGARWVHEVKLDGYRAQACFHDARAVVYSRGGHDWTERFLPIAAALANLPANGFAIDGEVVVADEHGRPNFGWLQADLAAGRHDRLLYYVFDLLWLDGFDLRAAPLVERKRVLAQILDKAPAPLLYSEHFAIEGNAMYAQACRFGLEGVLSKLADAPYRSGRGESWIKTKCVQRRKFVVVGFVPERASSIAALRLGEMRDGKLMYAGKVGTGFTRASGADVRQKLQPLSRPRPALDETIRRPGTVWVEPRFAADVEFLEMSADGRVRHPSFRGLSPLVERQPPSPRDRLSASIERAKAPRPTASPRAHSSASISGRPAKSREAH